MKYYNPVKYAFEGENMSVQFLRDRAEIFDSSGNYVTIHDRTQRRLLRDLMLLDCDPDTVANCDGFVGGYDFQVRRLTELRGEA